VVETLAPEGADHPFGDGVRAGRPHRGVMSRQVWALRCGGSQWVALLTLPPPARGGARPPRA
jgi:hypothetical protein